jgi:hypothetical protein
MGEGVPPFVLSNRALDNRIGEMAVLKGIRQVKTGRRGGQLGWTMPRLKLRSGLPNSNHQAGLDEYTGHDETIIFCFLPRRALLWGLCEILCLMKLYVGKTHNAETS